MMRRFFAIVSIVSLLPLSSYSQDEQGKIEVNGYTSTLTSAIFEKLKGPIIIDNLIHNRLNFKSYLGSKITFSAEARNRLFFGDMVRLSTGYAENIASDQGLVDMSWNIAKGNSLFINTTLDRLWLDFNSGRFQSRIGRQRINWGQTLIWNPNDIFNAYSYFDFDYVERPGSDAIRLQYYPGSSSTIELAIKSDYNEEVTAAALYRFNKWAYDIQLLSGVLQNDELVAGVGWSGAFGSVSFRGEGTWFQPFKSFSDTIGTGLFTIGADKFFGDNSALQVQVMICNNPYEFNNVTNLYSAENMSVKDLAFSKFSAFASYTYPVIPLFSTSVSGMWFPDLTGFFTGISADYSVAENVDISALWQHFDGVFGSTGRGRMNVAFLRIRFSY
ncbi:MAG TPA: hypothetical protein VHO50_07995 [Bacteroidales bacterium]|nr:hypothetical protein [Bacteroidales bacterium]